MQRLVADFLATRCSIFAQTTSRTYRSQQQAYLAFCAAARAAPVPASAELLALYAVFLGRRLQYNSIVQYLNVIRIMHQEAGLPNPLQENYLLHSTLRGLRRTTTTTSRVKRPLLPQQLLQLQQVCNLHNLEDLQFWTATLLMFHGMLRISNVLPSGGSQHFARKEDFIAEPWGVVLNVRSSETLLRGSAPSPVPYPGLPRHPLDPVRPLLRLFAHNATSTPSIPSASPFGARTASWFSRVFQTKLTACGIPPEGLTPHSLRRGGATWALKCGVPADVIQLLGNWRSDAYKQYLFADADLKRQYVRLVQQALPHAP